MAVVTAAILHYNAVVLLLQWRDASGGCASPLVSGPIDSVLRELGHDVLRLDQVWERLKVHVQEHMWLGSLRGRSTRSWAVDMGYMQKHMRLGSL